MTRRRDEELSFFLGSGNGGIPLENVTIDFIADVSIDSGDEDLVVTNSDKTTYRIPRILPEYDAGSIRYLTSAYYDTVNYTLSFGLDNGQNISLGVVAQPPQFTDFEGTGLLHHKQGDLLVFKEPTLKGALGLDGNTFYVKDFTNPTSVSARVTFLTQAGVGGIAVSGRWEIRGLDDLPRTSFGSCLNNQITLDPGRYICIMHISWLRSNWGRCRLQNVTDDDTVFMTPMIHSNDVSSGGTTVSYGTSDPFYVKEGDVFELHMIAGDVNGSTYSRSPITFIKIG